MIFSVRNHIQQIISGEKTQTRRKSGGYLVGKTYAIQPGRSQLGIPEGRVLITAKRLEEVLLHYPIGKRDAEAEGGYTWIEFEDLYRRMDYGWKKRYAYTFQFIPTEEAEV